MQRERSLSASSTDSWSVISNKLRESEDSEDDDDVIKTDTVDIIVEDVTTFTTEDEDSDIELATEATDVQVSSDEEEEEEEEESDSSESEEESEVGEDEEWINDSEAKEGEAMRYVAPEHIKENFDKMSGDNCDDDKKSLSVFRQILVFVTVYGICYLGLMLANNVMDGQNPCSPSFISRGLQYRGKSNARTTEGFVPLKSTILTSDQQEVHEVHHETSYSMDKNIYNSSTCDKEDREPFNVKEQEICMDWSQPQHSSSPSKHCYDVKDIEQKLSFLTSFLMNNNNKNKNTSIVQAPPTLHSVYRPFVLKTKTFTNYYVFISMENKNNAPVPPPSNIRHQPSKFYTRPARVVRVPPCLQPTPPPTEVKKSYVSFLDLPPINRRTEVLDLFAWSMEDFMVMQNSTNFFHQFVFGSTKASLLMREVQRFNEERQCHKNDFKKNMTRKASPIRRRRLDYKQPVPCAAKYNIQTSLMKRQDSSVSERKVFKTSPKKIHHKTENKVDWTTRSRGRAASRQL